MVALETLACNLMTSGGLELTCMVLMGITTGGTGLGIIMGKKFNGMTG